MPALAAVDRHRHVEILQAPMPALLSEPHHITRRNIVNWEFQIAPAPPGGIFDLRFAICDFAVAIAVQLQIGN
jgi:hypothetical protein